MKEETNIEKENFINQKKSEIDGSTDGIKENKGLFSSVKTIFNKININIQDEFIKDIAKRYNQLEFEDYLDIEEIKKDFSAIVEFDECISNIVGYRNNENEDIKEIIKIDVDGKEAFLAKREYVERTGNNSYVTRKTLNFFMKVNLDSRLHIKSIFPFFNGKRDVYEKCFLDEKKNIPEYDLKYGNDLKEALSESFYFQRFSVNSDAKLVEIDDEIKQKLLNIFNQYNKEFQIVIKDNLLRISIEIPIDIYESKYSILYDMEKTFEEVLEIFLELERQKNNEIFKNASKEYGNIKNIIFDLDNTIIFDTEEDSEYYREALINSGYSDDYFYGIYQVIDDYDKSISEENPYYNEKEMLDFINESLEQNFSMQVIEEIQKIVGREWTKRVLVPKEILEYLSSKYNLYIYTNYYQEAQTERIKNIGYDKYFKKIFGADKYGCKQFNKCFEKVLNEINAKPEETIMIGDDKSRDIVAANNMNMKSILFDYNGERDKKEIDVKDYIVIKDIKHLKIIL